MTPTYCCGFECGTSGAHGWNIGANTSISTSTVRSGARSLRVNPTAGQGFILVSSGHSSTTRHIGRFYINFATLPSADCRLVSFQNETANGPQIAFQQSDSKIYAQVGVTLGASGVSVTTGVWYRIDYDFNVNTGGADFCDVQVDGAACGQATATGTSTGSAIDAFGAMSTCTTDFFIDDLVCSDTAADYPIGAGYVNHFVPTSDGTHNVAGANDFEFTLTGTDITNATTTAYTLLDEIPLDSGTPTDFINLIAPAASTDYVEVKYGPAPGISTPTTAPRIIDVITVSAALSTTTNNLRLALVDNATTDDVRNATVGSTTCIYNRKQYATAPSGGAWNLAGSGDGAFDNLRMRCYSSDANPDPYFVGTMIEAEFEEVVSAGLEFLPILPPYRLNSNPNIMYAPNR